MIQIVWDLAWWYKKFYTTLAPASCELSFTLWSHGSTVHTLYMYVGMAWKRDGTSYQYICVYMVISSPENKYIQVHHSVVQKVSSLAVLCDTKSIKPCITWWYKNFQTTSHSVIQIVLNLARWYTKFYTTLAPASYMYCELSFTLWTHGSIVRKQDGGSYQCISVYTVISSPGNMYIEQTAYRACPSLQ